MGMAAMMGQLDTTLVSIPWYEKTESKALVCSSAEPWRWNSADLGSSPEIATQQLTVPWLGFRFALRTGFLIKLFFCN